MTTATATRPKATGEAGLRKWIDEVARGKQLDEVPPEDLLGDRLAAYFHEKVALLRSRYRAAEELEQGQQMMAAAAAIPEVSAADLVKQPVPAKLSWGQLVSNVQFLMDPHGGGGHPDSLRRTSLTNDARGLIGRAVQNLVRTCDPAIEAEIRRGQEQIFAVQTRVKERQPLLHLEEAIADTQVKCNRLATTGLSPEEAARHPNFNHTTHRRLLEQAKAELRELISQRLKVAKAQQEQEADETEVLQIKARMREAERRGTSAFAGMNWSD